MAVLTKKSKCQEIFFNFWRVKLIACIPPAYNAFHKDWLKKLNENWQQ